MKSGNIESTTRTPRRLIGPRMSINCLCLVAWTLLMTTGCATPPPWGALLEDDNSERYEATYRTIREQTKNCATMFDGNLTLNWNTGIDKRAFSLFVEFMDPTFFKLIGLNPLGQPVWAVSSNGADYQMLNTATQIFTTGTVRSYVLRNDIPPSFIEGGWFAWMTGRPLDTDIRIVAVQKDTAERGGWVSISDDREDAPIRERLLIDLKHQRLRERVIVGLDEKSEATIDYTDWETIAGCPQPMRITVTGLPYGAAAQLTLSDIKPATLTPGNFRLPVPPGYLKRYTP